MAKDAPAGAAPYTADSIRAYVANLYCGMELVDNRYADVTKMTGPARIADDVLQAACVVGTEIPDWQKLDFPNLKGRSLLDGKQLASGAGTAVMGSALISLAWLANTLNKHGTAAQGRRPHPHRLGPSAGVPARHRRGADGVRGAGRDGDHDRVKGQQFVVFPLGYCFFHKRTYSEHGLGREPCITCSQRRSQDRKSRRL